MESMPAPFQFNSINTLLHDACSKSGGLIGSVGSDSTGQDGNGEHVSFDFSSTGAMNAGIDSRGEGVINLGLEGSSLGLLVGGGGGGNQGVGKGL